MERKFILIGEVARRAGLTKDTVRFYERAGLISSGERVAGSRIYNEYAPEVVERLKSIRQWQYAGFTLREIKEVMDVWGDDIKAIPNETLIETVETKLAQVEAKLRDLEKVREYLSTKLASLRAESPS